MGGSFEGSVRDFGNESVVFNKGGVVEPLWPVRSEFDECQRDPLVALLDNPSLAENDFVQDNIMRVAVAVIRT